MIIPFPPLVKEIVKQIAKSHKYNELGVLHDLLTELGVDNRLWAMKVLVGECIEDEKDLVIFGFLEHWDSYDTEKPGFLHNGLKK